MFLENLWEENVLTLEGEFFHRRVHGEGPLREVRGDVVTLRALPLRSLTLGLVGLTDVVECRREKPGPQSIKLSGLKGYWKPYPIEYKRGKPKWDHTDEVQLMAQALCLEEMWQISIEKGALFYGRTLRRHEVFFTDVLRQKTRETIQQVRALLEEGKTPPAQKAKKCRSCSLVHLCLPDKTEKPQTATTYWKRMLTREEEP